MTLHRPSNVDDESHFFRLLKAVSEGARGHPVVFPVHPRTRKTLAGTPAFPSNLHFVDPQPYLEFNHLVRHAKAVITNSGGVTEEATVMGVPCMTLRDTTERPETVTVGTNDLSATDPARLCRHSNDCSLANGRREACRKMGRQGRRAHRRGAPDAALTLGTVPRGKALPEHCPLLAAGADPRATFGTSVPASP